MTLIDTLAKYPVKTIEIDGQLQAYREAGQGQISGYCTVRYRRTHVYQLHTASGGIYG